MGRRLKISNKELLELLLIEQSEFPKYSTQIMNLANQNAQGTRPQVVGQMSDFIEEFQGESFQEWVEWYNSKKPGAIDRATEKIMDMIEKLQDSISNIDKEMVKKWVEDLVYKKTYSGLKFQKAIIKKVSDELKSDYRIASQDEESLGIDGFIDDRPVSIKPVTYRTMSMLSENINVDMIYYEKKKNGLIIEFDF